MSEPVKMYKGTRRDSYDYMKLSINFLNRGYTGPDHSPPVTLPKKFRRRSQCLTLCLVGLVQGKDQAALGRTNYGATHQ